MFIMFLLSGNDATCISPESRPLIFVYLYLRTQTIQTLSNMIQKVN